MRILLLGGTGNLGKRLIPALLAHGHEVIAYVRSVPKLQSLVTPALFNAIKTHEGDALDSAAVEGALRQHNCDAVMNTAGNRVFDGSEQILGKIAASVSSAAIRVGKDRGKPLRAWFIGGLTSLEYPGTGGWKIQDYLPRWGSSHHRGTEEVMMSIDVGQLEWSLLCVAWMQPKSETIDLLAAPQHHQLVVATGKPPEWRDSWIRYLPFVGVYLNLVPAVLSYTTKLEDVADLLAEDFEKGNKSEYVGQFVGMKDVGKAKSS
jgi:putative NADH-flavin reductase